MLELKIQSSFHGVTLVNMGCLGLRSCQSDSYKKKKNFFRILIRSSKTIFLWLLECKYETLKKIMVKWMVKVTFTQRAKQYLLVCTELLACHTLIWKAAPLLEKNILGMEFMRNMPFWTSKEKAYPFFVCLFLFNLCSTQKYMHTQEYISWYLESGYIVPKICYFIFFPLRISL